MDDPLSTYLHDHLAGSNFAIELLEAMEKRYPGHETGTLAGSILKDVREDQGTLERIIAQVGKSHLDLKEAVAWLAEKASRAKLSDDDPTGIGPFEAFETLSLGIRGKLGLWRVLPEVSTVDSRIGGFDFAALAARAREQFSKVEEYRLRLARSAFQKSV